MANVGEPTYAADLNNLVSSTRKTTDTGRASTTTVTMDPELVITLDASKYYVFMSVISYNGDPAADLKGGFAPPSGGSFTGTVRAQPTAASATSGSIVTDMQTGGTSFGFGCLSTSTNLTAFITGLLYTGTGGSFGFQWAQVASNATATTVKAGSYFTLLLTS